MVRIYLPSEEFQDCVCLVVKWSTLNLREGTLHIWHISKKLTWHFPGTPGKWMFSQLLWSIFEDRVAESPIKRFVCFRELRKGTKKNKQPKHLPEKLSILNRLWASIAWLGRWKEIRKRKTIPLPPIIILFGSVSSSQNVYKLLFTCN